MKSNIAATVLCAGFLFTGHVAAFAGNANVPASKRSKLALWSAMSYETLGDTDTEKLLSQSTFPIKPEVLLNHAKETVFVKGIGTKDGGACLADDFVFRAQFVELDKEKYQDTYKTINLNDSFDIKSNCFGWHVDPFQPNRVWFLYRREATHTKKFMGVEPTGKRLVFPPEVLHVDFNEEGKVKEYGFYTADRAQGNTGGLGGAFGYFYGVGKPLPFPEGKPYQMSIQRRIVDSLGSLITWYFK